MLYNPPTGGAANDSYVGKNVAAGIQGSKIPPGAAEFPQRELINLILAAGLSPTNSDLTQLTQGVAAGGIFIGTFGYVPASPGNPAAGVAATPEAYTAKIPGNVIIPASRAGMRIIGYVPAANATGSPMLAVAGFLSGSAAAPLRKRDGTPTAIGDIGGGLAAFTLDPAGTWRLGGLTQSDVLALILANPTIVLQAINSVNTINPLPGIVNVQGIPNVYSKVVWNNAYGAMEGFGSLNYTGDHYDFTLPVSFTTDALFTCLYQDTNALLNPPGGPGVHITGGPISGGVVRLFARNLDGTDYIGNLAIKYICMGHQ